jgi:hypothetical protein
MSTPQKLLYTKRETAEMLSLSLRMIDNLIARDQLQVRRFGKRVLVIGASLKRLASGRQHLDIQRHREAS